MCVVVAAVPTVSQLQIAPNDIIQFVSIELVIMSSLKCTRRVNSLYVKQANKCKMSVKT